jgi:hypothetical protein
MSTYASRERAAEAFGLRSTRYSWREIRDRLGYRSVGAAQSAVNRHVARNRRGEAKRVTVESHKAAIETRTRAMSQRFVAAFRNGDDDTMVTLNSEISRNEVELAKLDELYPDPNVKVDVSVSIDPAALLAETRQRLMSVIDGEVVETKELGA